MTNTNDWNGLLLDLATSTKEGLSKGIDFAMEQAPDVVHQLLLWKFWSSISAIILFGVPCLFLVFFSLKYWRQNWKICLNNDGDWIALNVFGLFISLSLLIPISLNLNTALKINLAPKLYLIEYVSNLAKR